MQQMDEFIRKARRKEVFGGWKRICEDTYFSFEGKLKTRCGSDECEKDAGDRAGWIDVGQLDSG